MKKVMVFVAFLALAILLVGTVYAAGTSTKASKVIDSNSTNVTEKNISEKPRQNMMAAGCDAIGDRRARIKCRLANKDLSLDSTIEETCKSSFNPMACQRLYENSQKCYEKSGGEKDRCLKIAAGFKRAQLVHEAKENNESVRNYMLLVLYNLQEKVEKANEAGKITDDAAASLIDQIVETKQDILEGKTRAQIKYDVQQLKTKWRYLMNDLKAEEKKVNATATSNLSSNETQNG